MVNQSISTFYVKASSDCVAWNVTINVRVRLLKLQRRKSLREKAHNPVNFSLFIALIDNDNKSI